MKKLLIAVAITEELKVVKKFLDDKVQLPTGGHTVFGGTIGGYPVDVLLTSMGMDAALKASSDVIKSESYGGVLVLGYCGGLSLALKVGDAVIPAKVIGPDIENEKQTGPKSPIAIETELCEKLGKIHCAEGLNYRNVPLITQPKVIETPEDKQKLYDQTRAEAVDMESFVVASVAAERDVRAAVIKVVIDDVETELPKFNEHFEKVGKMDHLNVASVLMSAPALSLKLSANMKKAAQVLTKSIPQIVPVVCEHWGIKKNL